ncbi:hypothetical protein LOK49_LG06G01694 [Camellia lanceoleosa]|uniref:Uncharacterized protein n=1 Tax=Camellia lanceoleosa TaxID=1840588 RepID=A0ACC0HIQ4_9ERIC|nr:hypothetical protein LOK49_LG06G01694 [Camellia lanceoleosa]
MNTLVKNATLGLSRRLDGYEPLDRRGEATGDDNRSGSWRTLKIEPQQRNTMTTSFSFRRERAMKRQIFLRTYKLGSINSPRGKSMCCRELKKVAVKVKSVVVSAAVSFVRFNSLASCNCRSAICASSPTRVRK